jgi:hypothetical protein
MREKIGVKDQISFVLNGKPVQPAPPPQQPPQQPQDNKQ